jgi:hypothetical protein
VSKITFTVVKSRGERPRETKCNGAPDLRLHTARHKEGKNSVWALSGNRRSNAVMQSKTVENPEGKTPKVAKYSIVADEVVVANISRRVPMKIGTSEGLHIIGSKLYNNLIY